MQKSTTYVSVQDASSLHEIQIVDRYRPPQSYQEKSCKNVTFFTIWNNKLKKLKNHRTKLQNSFWSFFENPASELSRLPPSPNKSFWLQNFDSKPNFWLECVLWHFHKQLLTQVTNENNTHIKTIRRYQNMFFQAPRSN